MTDYTRTGFPGAPPTARFRFGDAIQSAFDACFKNFVPFLLVALVVYALPTVVIALVFPSAAAAGGSPMFGIGLILRGIVGLVAGSIFQGALTRGVVTHLTGVKPAFADMLRTGLTAAAPLIGVGLLAGLGIGVGLVFFIIPGLFLIALWGVAAPAVVIEHMGVFGALGRSARLTQGHRWAVLGAFVLFTIIMYVALLIGGVLIGVTAGVGAAAGGAVLTPQIGPTFILTQVIGAVLGAIGAIFFYALPASLYFELRRSKEGSTPAELASVFD